jgi:tRNA-dihydrouridine synthase B
MKQILQPIQIGNLTLRCPVFYAPLAGCSDFPFRKMSSLYKPGIHFCEMVKLDPLIYGHARTLQLLDYSPEMHPIGAQLCGSKLELAGQAAKIIEELGFDLIDFNCGCPVDKITKDGSGSAMLKTPELIGEMIAAMKAAVKNIPITVKIRAGWDEESINAPEIVKIAEQAGASAICVHARTREQAYHGPANWDYIKACKEAATTIKVIGNGDVRDGISAEKMMEYTGCDAVLVARGSMGQPWIVEDILRYSQGEEPLKRGIDERRQALLEHFYHSVNYYKDHRACLHIRRFGCWYLKEASGVRQFREQISQAESIEAIQDLILHFPIGEFVENGDSAGEIEQ